MKKNITIKVDTICLVMAYLGAISLAVIYAITPVLAQADSLGDFYRRDNVTLTQVCPTCSYVYLSYVVTPHGNYNISQNMTQSPTDSSLYTYLFQSTESLGEYSYYGYGDPSGDLVPFAVDFTVKDGSAFGLDMSNPTFIVVVIFGLLFVGFMLFKKMFVYSAFILVILGFVFLYNDLNAVLSLIIIAIGVGVAFLK